MSKEKNLGEFIQAVNKEVISTIISKQTNPLKPSKQFTCLMQDVRVQLDVNVTSERKVTDGEGVAASLHLEYGYVPMLPREQVKPGSVPPKESGTAKVASRRPMMKTMSMRRSASGFLRSRKGFLF